MHKQHHIQKTAQKSAPTSSGYEYLSNTPNSTAPTSEWVHEPEAATLLAIKHGTLPSAANPVAFPGLEPSATG